MFDFNAKSRIDTLIYKYGGFIEKNKLASYDISEIEYYTSSGWTGISPVYKLKILRNGNATFVAISDSPKKIIPPTKANKDTVQSIVDLIQHVNIKTLKNKYQVTWFDDTTIYLKIIFRDRTIKEIEDYGMIGTFGLNQLYQLLFSLNKKADK